MLPRVIEDVVRARLRTHGGVLIEEPKAVGKTTTAARLSGSSVRLDRDAAALRAATGDPQLVLDGGRPRLIDEFHHVPGL